MLWGSVLQCQEQFCSVRLLVTQQGDTSICSRKVSWPVCRQVHFRTLCLLHTRFVDRPVELVKQNLHDIMVSTPANTVFESEK